MKESLIQVLSCATSDGGVTRNLKERQKYTIQVLDINTLQENWRLWRSPGGKKYMRRFEDCVYVSVVKRNGFYNDLWKVKYDYIKRNGTSFTFL